MGTVDNDDEKNPKHMYLAEFFFILHPFWEGNMPSSRTPHFYGKTIFS